MIELGTHTSTKGYIYNLRKSFLIEFETHTSTKEYIYNLRKVL